MPTLSSTLPELQAAERKLRELAAARGITYTIADFGAVRTEADTVKILGYREKDYARYVAELKMASPGKKPVPIEQWRPIAPFGLSYHNWGAAFDVRIASAPAGVDGYQVLGSLAPLAGLRWGGTFKNGRADPYHFELAISLTEARARWYKLRGLTDPRAAGASGSRPGLADAATLAALAIVAALLYLLVRLH